MRSSSTWISLPIICVLLASCATPEQIDDSAWRALDEQVCRMIDENKTEGAPEIASNALVMAESRWGPNHRNVAISLGRLAWLHRHSGDEVTGRQENERARTIWWDHVIPEDKRLLGASHLQVADDYQRAAIIFINCGMEAQAEDCYKAYVRIVAKRLTPNDDEYARAMYRLARFYDSMENREKANAYNQKYKDAMKRRVPANKPSGGDSQ
jgi:hypothetical protein